MEPLKDSIRSLVTNLEELISKSTQFKKNFKQLDIKCNESDKENLLHEIAINFKKEFAKRVDALLDETEMSDRVEELKELISTSNEMNSQIGLTEGYRPTDPTTDMNGHLEIVQTSYLDTLNTLSNRVDQEIMEKKNLLNKKMEVLEILENNISSLLGK